LLALQYFENALTILNAFVYSQLTQLFNYVYLLQCNKRAVEWVTAAQSWCSSSGETWGCKGSGASNLHY